MPTHAAWLNQVAEEVLEPDLPITDAHHHLWEGSPFRHQPDYLIPELHQDLNSGHNIVATVCVEAGFGYREAGPQALRPVGETERANRLADGYTAQFGARQQVCAGIVAFADFRLGAAMDEVLEAHQQAAPQRLRGIRQMAAWDADPRVAYPDWLGITQGMLLEPAFQQAFACLAPRNLSFDAWLFYPQLPELIALASAFENTQIILNHLGGPLGIGAYVDRGDEVFSTWKRSIRQLSQLPNVAIKLGGTFMPSAGHAFHRSEAPPTSDQLVAAAGHYYLHAIDCFGPERCMFESNFPVEKLSASYTILWNAFKKISRGFSSAERAQLFNLSARRIYRLG